MKKSLKEKDRIRWVPCVMMTWMPGGVPLVPDHPNCSDPVRSNIELTLTNLQLKSVTGLLPLDTINSRGLGGHRGILCSGDLCLS